MEPVTGGMLVAGIIWVGYIVLYVVFVNRMVRRDQQRRKE